MYMCAKNKIAPQAIENQITIFKSNQHGSHVNS